MTEQPHNKRPTLIIGAAVIAVFLMTSLFSWNKPVSSMELNRNDAAFYMVLAKNLLNHQVYSHRQTEPFTAHTEWPPGIPILHAIPMSVVQEFPLGNHQWIVHAWMLLIGSVAVFAVYRYLLLFTSPSTAGCITAAVALSKAFLDGSQAAMADVPAVAVTFFALHEIEVYFEQTKRSKLRSVAFFIGLALLPIIKPYLGLVYVPFLWKLLVEKPIPWPQRFAKIAIIGLCCLPFAAFIGYSMTAAQQEGTISAITWLTDENPVQSREGVAEAAGRDWVGDAVFTIKYALIYHFVDGPFPVATWLQVRDWATPIRYTALLFCLSMIAVGVWQAFRNRQAAPIGFLATMLATFVALKCDNPRFYVVIAPLVALYFCSGAITVARRLSAQGTLNWAPQTAMATTAVLSALFWCQHKYNSEHDPDPLYNELYTTLFEIRDSADTATVVLPFQLREIAIVETGKRILSYEEFLAEEKPEDYVVLKIQADEFFESKRLAFPQRMAEYVATVDHETVDALRERQIRILKPISINPSDGSNSEKVAQSP